jgi:hypothetical protein
MNRKKTSQTDPLSLVDPTRENWNCIFSDFQRLSEQLQKLGIDAMMEANNG